MKMTRMICLLLVTVIAAGMLAGCGSCSHKWLPADCENPRTCYNCGLTEGEPTDTHLWEEATTDHAKRCTVCGLTDGERIDVDDRFHTEDCKALFGNWVTDYEMDGSMISMSELKFDMKLTMTFTNEGELTIKKEFKDKSKAEKAIAETLTQMLYDQYEANGMTQSQADAACKSQHGMTVPEFANYRADQIADVLTDTQYKVYYVENDRLYSAEDWDSNMGSQIFSVQDGGKMLLQDSEDDQPVEYTRVATVK